MDTKLLAELQLIINTLPYKDTYYIIARYLVDHIRELDKININDLADACFTSTATISRFVRSIGYENFATMKSTLQSSNTKSFKELMIDNRQGLALETNQKDELLLYVNDISAGLRNMAEKLDLDRVDRLVELIHDSKKVYFCGIQFPGMISSYIQFLLFNCKKVTQVAYTNQHHMKMLEDLKSDTNNSLVIVLSTNGNYLRMYNNVIIELIELGVKTAIVTHDQNLKRIKEFNEVILLGDTLNSKLGRYRIQFFVEILVNRYYIKYQHELDGE